LDKTAIIDALREHNEDFRRLEQEHIELEGILERFNEKKHLTTEEEVERKTIQKKKLLGKDRMEAMIREYRETAEA
jgi:uncharacterized protein YdcH (DUF465 family)